MHHKVHSSVLLIVVAVFLSFTATSLDVSGVQTMSYPKVQQDTCDKITNLELSICWGESVEIGGENYSETGSYIDTLTAENGCDSIVFLSLVVNPEYFDTVSVSICEGQAYDFVGQLLSWAGVYTANLTSENGCDSLVVLFLTVTPVTVITIDTTICEGRGIFTGGIYVSTSGTFVFEFTASTGCDSVVIYNITIERLEVPITISGNSLIVTDTAFIYQWINCDTGENIPGPNSNTYTPIVSGNYSVDVLFYDDCIGSSDCVEFIVTGTAEDALSNAVSIYPNPTDGLIYITNDSAYPVTSAVLSSVTGRQIEKFILAGKNTLDLSSLAKGMYLIKLEMNNTQVIKKVIIK